MGRQVLLMPVGAGEPLACDAGLDSESFRKEELLMSLVGTLIAGSLLLFAGLGVAALFLSGSSSRTANDDDPKNPRTP